MMVNLLEQIKFYHMLATPSNLRSRILKWENGGMLQNTIHIFHKLNNLPLNQFWHSDHNE